MNARGETRGFRMYNYKRTANVATVDTRKMYAINRDKGIPYELNKGDRHFVDTMKTLAR